jgi:hypothetical protein
LKIVGLIALSVGAGQGAFARSVDYSALWLCSELILSGKMALRFAQVRDIPLTGSQIAGLSRGSKGACSAVGVASGCERRHRLSAIGTGSMLTPAHQDASSP